MRKASPGVSAVLSALLPRFPVASRAGAKRLTEVKPHLAPPQTRREGRGGPSGPRRGPCRTRAGPADSGQRGRTAPGKAGGVYPDQGLPFRLGVRRPHWQDPGDPARETPGARVHESVSVRAPAARLPAEGPPRSVPPRTQPQGALGIRPGLPARTRRPQPSLGLRAAVSPRPLSGPARGLAKRCAAG